MPAWGVDGIGMPAFSFANSAAFHRASDAVFKSVDKNGDGIADEAELLVAMCKLHFKLSRKFPGVTEPPTIDEVRAKIAEYDTDLSGGLDRVEFRNFASRWFKQNGVVFLQRMVLTAFIGMVVLPEAAVRLQRKVPGFRRLPGALFKVIFGVAFKLIATRMPTLE